jgi:hypothetical protein
VREKIPNFSHLQGMKGRGMDNALKFFYHHPHPNPPPLRGREYF